MPQRAPAIPSSAMHGDGRRKRTHEGETHCKCGRPVTQEVYKPLPRRESSARGAADTRRGQAQAAAKAKAKAKPTAKPKAKAKATPAPWRRPQEGTKPTTGPRSAYQLLPDAVARAATDDVAYAEEQLRLLEAIGRPAKLPAARRELAEAHRLQQERLPPQARLKLLKEELMEAEQELDQRERAVADTEEALNQLEEQLTEQRSAVEDGRAKVDRLYRAVETTELQIPPETQKEESAATEEALNQALLKAQRILNQLQGDDLTEANRDEVIIHLQALQAKGEEAAQARRQKLAQEAQDAEMAQELHEAEVRQLQGDDHAHAGEWHEPRARKGKGTGRPTGEGTSPAAEQPFLQPHEIGPLATAAPKAERPRSPRRQTGTPARATPEAAGPLAPPAASPAASPEVPAEGKPFGRGDDSIDDL